MDDNKTYKDTYHFTGRFMYKPFSKATPSLNPDNKDVKTIIKENPYESNVEIEGGEVVLNPDLSALFKAHGKKHSKGGMDVYLKPDSFVFSADKSLEFSEEDAEDLELKLGGKKTPAEVLKKNIDLEHYNRLVTNLTDVKKDDLAKKSSAMMLEKYVESLGRIAFKQEQKKQFPQGYPDFFSGILPPENEELESEIESQKQYSKYGGRILPKFELAGIFDEQCPCGRDSNGNCLECKDPSKWQSTINSAKRVGAAPTGSKLIYTSPSGENLYQKYIPGVNPVRKKPTDAEKAAYAQYLKTETPELKARRLAREARERTPASDEFYLTSPIKPNFPDINLEQFWKVPVTNPFDDTEKKPTSSPINTIEPISIDQKDGERMDINWQFTPWQKLSQLYNASKMAGVRRYMPIRSRFNPTYNEDYLLNSQQIVGDTRAVGNSAVDAVMRTLNPILSGAQSQNIYGNVINQIPGIESNIDNQNQMIKNQGSLTRTQIANNANLQNMQNDQAYHKESVVGRQNFDNLRTFHSDQYMNNLLRDVETNQTLAYRMASNPNSPWGFDFKTGQFYLTGKDPLSVPSGGADLYDRALKGLDNLSDSDPKKWEIYERILRQKNILPFMGQIQQSVPFKMGGKMRGKKK